MERERSAELLHILVFFGSVYVVLEAPLRAIYHYPQSELLRLLEMLVSLLFGLELASNSWDAWRRRSDEPGALTTYLKGWFWLDLLTALPMDLFATGLPLSPQTARFAHLVRYARLMRSGRLLHSAIEMRKSRFSHAILPGILRLVWFAFWALLGTHWIACGWLLLSEGRAPIPSVTEYIQALYWTVTTLSTVGYGDIVPLSNGQRLYSMAVMLLGVSAYTFVIGNVASVLASLDFARNRLQEKQDRLMRFLRSRKVPRALQEQIHKYYDYLIEHEKGYDEKQLLAGLPHALYTGTGRAPRSGSVSAQHFYLS